MSHLLYIQSNCLSVIELKDFDGYTFKGENVVNV